MTSTGTRYLVLGFTDHTGLTRCINHTWLTGSVQQSPVNRPVHFEHVPVTPGPGKTRYRSNDRYPVPGPGTRCSVPPITPGKPGTVATPGTPITPGSQGSTVTPGESVRPVPSSSDTGHSARLAKKGSVQQSLVNLRVYSEHVPVKPGPGKPGTGQMTGTRYWDPVPGAPFHRPHRVNWMHRPHRAHRVG